MAVDDLPLPVVNFLNVIGVPWPYIDEDVVSDFATLTRNFATAVRTTHDDATQTLTTIASVYQGASTDAMTYGWAKLSARHVDEIVDGCHLLAGALDVAAGYIVAQKAEAVAVLIGMAAAFVADQAGGPRGLLNLDGAWLPTRCRNPRATDLSDIRPRSPAMCPIVGRPP